MYALLTVLFIGLPAAIAMGITRYVRRVPDEADPAFGTKPTAAVAGLALFAIHGIIAGCLLAAHPVAGVLGFVSLAFAVAYSAIWLARYDKKSDNLRESAGLIRRLKTRSLAIYAYLAGKLVDRLQKSRVRAVIGVYNNLAAEGEAEIEQARRTEDKLKNNPDAKRERRAVQERRREVQREVAALRETADELHEMMQREAIPGLVVDRPALVGKVTHTPARLGLGSLPVIATVKDAPRVEQRAITDGASSEVLPPAVNPGSDGKTA